MPSLFFRHLFNIYCCIYTYRKVININLSKKTSVFYDSIFSLFLAFVLTLLSSDNSSINLTLTLMLCSVYISLSTKTKFNVVFVAALLSLSISLISLSLSSFIIGFIMIFCFSGKPFINNWSMISIGVLQFLTVFLLFKNKRLKKGMPFLYNKSHITFGFSHSLTLVVLFLLFQKFVLIPLLPRLIFFISIIALAFLLIYWWRRKITQEYVKKLRLEEREELYNKISAKEQEIEKLRIHNEHLGRIIHKDNKLIPAMEYAVCNYLQTIAELNSETGSQIKNTTSPPKQTLTPDQLLLLQKHGEDLILQLQQMASERDGILSTYEKNFARHTQIGIPSIDAVLQYMEKRAGSSRIRYKMKFDPNLKETMLKQIEEHDVLHMLSDLIENAIIAVSHADKKEILIHIGFSYDHLFFDIYDSGVPFTIETYQNFGNRPYTTYPDSGGSGIGLTDIWNLKRKYKASLQIYESPPGKDAYTKRIRILFDHKNHFLIQTYRAKEIRSNIIRNDLHVFPYSEHSSIDNAEEATAI